MYYRKPRNLGKLEISLRLLPFSHSSSQSFHSSVVLKGALREDSGLIILYEIPQQRQKTHRAFNFRLIRPPSLQLHVGLGILVLCAVVILMRIFAPLYAFPGNECYMHTQLFK